MQGSSSLVSRWCGAAAAALIPHPITAGHTLARDYLHTAGKRSAHIQLCLALLRYLQAALVLVVGVLHPLASFLALVLLTDAGPCSMHSMVIVNTL